MASKKAADFFAGTEEDEKTVEETPSNSAVDKEIEEVVEETTDAVVDAVSEVVPEATDTPKKKRVVSEETKAKLRDSMKKAFSDPTKHENLRKGIQAAAARRKEAKTKSE